MSGARLETAGQVRNGIPWITRKAIIPSALSLVSAVPAVQSYSIVTVSDGNDIPFDYGPDKPGRVFVAINGFSFIINATTYAAGGQLVGDIFWQDTGGLEIHLMTICDFLPNAIKLVSDRLFVAYTPLFSPNVDFIGKLVWKNNGTTIAALNNVNATARINVAYYSDYAEYDFNQLKKCEHHHYHGVEDKPEVDMTPV